MTRTTLGVVIGLALGLALAFGSFGQIAKVLEGDLDLGPYLSGRREDR